MFLINPQITNNIYTNDGYNDLLEDIDKAIAGLAKSQLLVDSYGFDKKVDYKKYRALCEYKEILLAKFIGCNCLEDLNITKIISRVQKLIS